MVVRDTARCFDPVRVRIVPETINAHYNQRIFANKGKKKNIGPIFVSVLPSVSKRKMNLVQLQCEILFLLSDRRFQRMSSQETIRGVEICAHFKLFGSWPSVSAVKLYLHRSVVFIAYF